MPWPLFLVQEKPRDHDDLDSQLTHGRNVVGYIWVLAEKSAPITKDVGEGK
jgi:hypothetical protein